MMFEWRVTFVELCSTPQYIMPRCEYGHVSVHSPSKNGHSQICTSLIAYVMLDIWYICILRSFGEQGTFDGCQFCPPNWKVQSFLVRGLGRFTLIPKVLTSTKLGSHANVPSAGSPLAGCADWLIWTCSGNTFLPRFMQDSCAPIQQMLWRNCDWCIPSYSTFFQLAHRRLERCPLASFAW